MNPAISTRTTKTAGGQTAITEQGGEGGVPDAIREERKAGVGVLRSMGCADKLVPISRKRLRDGVILPAVKAGFAEVAVEAAGVSSSIIVHMNPGVLLEVPIGADPGWVAIWVGGFRNC